MKTKIIYISGNEVFEMAQIRAAFEEVRNTLGLDNDTILFGVPVDADNALANAVSEPETIRETNPIVKETEETTEPDIINTPIVSEIIEPEATLETVAEIITEPIAETKTITESTEYTAETDAVIPILSILSTNEDTPEQPLMTPETVTESDTIEQTDVDGTDALTVSIDDVVADEAPVVEHKKTLEELLESMEPLAEDKIPETPSAPEEVIEEDADFSVSMTDDIADTDATLAQLANEFAQAQDKIPETPKTSSNGKIGKLKNILPFKKAKRDDSSLMGDLFGWAGIAANDEDFSIPGFFTSAGGQK